MVRNFQKLGFAVEAMAPQLGKVFNTNLLGFNSSALVDVTKSSEASSG